VEELAAVLEARARTRAAVLEVGLHKVAKERRGGDRRDRDALLQVLFERHAALLDERRLQVAKRALGGQRLRHERPKGLSQQLVEQVEVLVPPLRAQHRLHAMHDEDGVDEICDELVAVCALALPLCARDAHALQRHVHRVGADLGAAAVDGRVVGVRRACAAIGAQIGAHMLLIELMARRAVGLVQELSDGAVTVAVRHRKHGKVLIELAEGVVHLHHERHGGCIAIVVRQQQA